MGSATGIAWCHATFNAFRGCTKVSAGCKNCYAEKLSARNPKSLGIWGKGGSRPIASEAYWKQLADWDRWACEGTCHKCGGKSVRKTPGRCEHCDGTGREPGGQYRARVFCSSLSDVFEGADTMPADAWGPVQEARARLFLMAEKLKYLDFLFLTKRPENVPELAPGTWAKHGWPLNVWMGTSAEDQASWDLRIPQLAKIPAAVRWVSAEPLLSSIFAHTLDRIDWVIVGGESGPGARPMSPDWAREFRDICLAQRRPVPFFFKQWGDWLPESQGATWEGPEVHPNLHQWSDQNTFSVRMSKEKAGHLLDGKVHQQFPVSPAARFVHKAAAPKTEAEPTIGGSFLSCPPPGPSDY